MFPEDGWLLDLKLAKCATAEHIWQQISQSHKIEEQDTYGIFTEKGVMMSENTPLIHFKIKNKVMRCCRVCYSCVRLCL